MIAILRPSRTLLALSAAFLLAPTVHGQTWTNFTGLPDSFWTNAANWTALPAFNNTTMLNFSSTPPLTGLPFQPTGNYTSTANGIFTVNQMAFNNFASPDFSAFGVTITSAAAGDTIIFDGTNPMILQNGTGSVTFANGTATTDLTLTAAGLTIGGTGTGHMTVAGVIGGTGNLTINQTGAGPFGSGALITLSGANTYVGSTTLQAGNLVIGSATALGPAATNSLIINGGSVRNLGGAAAIIANPIQLNSQLFISGLGAAANDMTFTGAVSGNGGILVKPSGGTGIFTFQGSISGTGAIVLDSFGGGVPVMVLSAGGTATNATSYSITNGQLTVDNTATPLTRLRTGAPVAMNGSFFVFNGSATAATSETLGALTANGLNFLTLAPNAAQPHSLTFGSLSCANNRATIQVSNTVASTTLGGTPGNGVANVFFTTSLAGDNINGVLPYVAASIGNGATATSTFARYNNATGITPLLPADYNSQHPYLVGNQPTANLRLVATGGDFGNTFGGITGTTSVNSLLMETAGGAAQTFGAALYGSGTINLTSGALMTTLTGGATAPVVLGSVIQPNIALGAAGYFHIQHSSATNTMVIRAFPAAVTFTIAGPGLTVLGDITGTNGLVKSGNQRLLLAGNNSGLTGGLFINGGPLNFSADNNLGAAGAGITFGGSTAVGASLNFFPTNQFGDATVKTVVVNRPIDLGAGGGIINAVLPGSVLALPGTISGGRLVTDGPGVLLLSGGNNSYMDTVIRVGGYVAANSDLALGNPAGSVFIDTAGTFQANAPFTTSRDFVFNGPGGASPSGAAVLFTPGTNHLTINGQLRSVVASATANSGGNLVKSGTGTLTLTQAATFAAPVVIGEGVERRAGAMFAQTGGEIVLSGANGSLAQATIYTLNQGTRLTLDNSAAINNNRIGSSQVTMNGAELLLRGNANGSVTEHAGGATTNGLSITAGLGSTITVQQPTSAGGQSTNLVFTSYSNPVVTAQGAVLFRGDNLGGTTGDFTNVTFVAAPTLTNNILANGLYSNSSTGNPQDFATIGGGNRIVAFTGYVPLPATGGLATDTHSQTGALALTGAVASNALKMSNGQIDLAGQNLSIGGATSAGQLLSTGQDIIANNGAAGAGLVFTGSSAKFTVNALLDVGSAAAPVNITTASGLTKFGPGNLRISNATGVTGGGINLAQGQITLLTATALPAGQNFTMAPGATLDIGNFGTPAAPVATNTLAGFGTVRIGTGAFSTGTAASTFGGSFEGSGTLIKNAGAVVTQVVGNSPNFSGDVRILGGTLFVNADVRPGVAGAPGPLGTGTTPIQLGDTTGAVAATLQLGQLVNEFHRDIIVPAGGTATNVLRAVNGNNAASANVGNLTTVSSNITLQGRTLQVSVGQNAGTAPSFGGMTLTGTISGTPGANGFALIHEGGNINLWGNNNFTGNVQVFAYVRAVMGLGTDTALGVPANNLVFNSGTFSSTLRADNGARTIANMMDFATIIPTAASTVGISGVNDLNWTGGIAAGNAARTFDISNTGTTTFSGTITSTGTAGSLIKNGAGTLVLSGDSTFAGGTTMNAGVLGLGRDSTGGPVASGPVGSGAFTVNGGTLRATGGSRIVNNAVTVGGNFAVDGSNALTLGGAMNLGATTRILTITNTQPTTFSGGIATSPAGLTKQGAGTLILATGSTNSYAGATNVNGGTLQVNGLLDGSGTQVFINNGGTLSGTGNVARAVTANTGSTLKPGTSPGILTVGGAVTMNAGSTFSGEAQGITAGTGPGFHSQLLGGAGISLDTTGVGVTLSMAFSGYTPAMTDQLQIVRLTGGGIAGTFAGMPEGGVAFSNVLGSGIDYRIWYGSLISGSITLAPVPEPVHILLMCGGAAVGVRWFRKRRKAKA